MASKNIPTSAVDFIKQEIVAGDWVLVHMRYGLSVGQITRFTPKMVVVQLSRKEHSAYGNELVKLPPEQVTWYLLSRKDTKS